MDEIMAALTGLSGVKKCCMGWPKAFDTLPCLSVSESADIPATYADDGEWEREQCWYVRVFSTVYAECDRLARLVVGAMRGLGYERDMKYDDDDDEIKMKVLRFTRRETIERMD